MKKIIYLAVGLLFLPALAHAELGNIGTLTEKLTDLVRSLIPVTFGLAVAIFFWGLARYMLNSGSEESKAEGRRIMIGGVIALFIMSSIWALVEYIASDLGIDRTKDSMGIPNVNTEPK